MISHKHKFIYIHVPKCGGTSLRGKINPYCEIRANSNFGTYNYHKSVKDLKNHFIDKKWNWSTYTKIAPVRNPWDRTVSLWAFGNRRKLLSITANGKEQNTCNDFTAWLHSNCAFLDRHWGYTTMIRDPKGEVLIDDFIRLENFQEDFNIICDKLGIPHQKLPHKNKTKHKHYTEYYNDETRQIVAEKYVKDIEYFNYKFENRRS